MPGALSLLFPAKEHAAPIGSSFMDPSRRREEMLEEAVALRHVPRQPSRTNLRALLAKKASQRDLAAAVAVAQQSSAAAASQAPGSSFPASALAPQPSLHRLPSNSNLAESAESADVTDITTPRTPHQQLKAIMAGKALMQQAQAAVRGTSRPGTASQGPRSTDPLDGWPSRAASGNPPGLAPPAHAAAAKGEPPLSSLPRAATGLRRSLDLPHTTTPQTLPSPAASTQLGSRPGTEQQIVRPRGGSLEISSAVARARVAHSSSLYFGDLSNPGHAAGQNAGVNSFADILGGAHTAAASDVSSCSEAGSSDSEEEKQWQGPPSGAQHTFRGTQSRSFGALFNNLGRASERSGSQSGVGTVAPSPSSRTATPAAAASLTGFRSFRQPGSTRADFTGPVAMAAAMAALAGARPQGGEQLGGPRPTTALVPTPPSSGLLPPPPVISRSAARFSSEVVGRAGQNQNHTGSNSQLWYEAVGGAGLGPRSIASPVPRPLPGQAADSTGLQVSDSEEEHSIGVRGVWLGSSKAWPAGRSHTGARGNLELQSKSGDGSAARIKGGLHPPPSRGASNLVHFKDSSGPGKPVQREQAASNMDDLMRLLVPAEKAAHGARDMVSPTGISLAYLFRLGEALPQHTRAMSTYQVAQELMHLTQASQCRLLDRCPALCRALPKYFIIHCWQAQFHHTMAQLRRYAHEHGLDTSTTIVWMDLVCANLHCPSLGARDPAVLKEVLRTCKQVVLVLDPLASPFTRTWCCYELWVAMRLPPKSKFLQCEDRLHIVAYEPNWLHFAGLLVGLRLDGTKASRVPDQQRLLQELKEDPELVPKQEQVGTVLLAGLLAASAAQLEVAERSRQAYPRRYTSAATQRALMLAAGGHMWEAEKAVRALLQEHQEQRALLPPQEHAALTTGLASLIALGGYPEEAHRLVCEALRHQQAAGNAPGAEAGSRSESLQAAQLVCSTEVLAHALHCLNQHTEAERVAKRVLASATPGAAPGAGGPLAETETEPGKGSGAAPSRGYILSLRHMAAIKARASQMDRALQYQRHALFLAEKHLPMQHMDLGAIRSELAQLLHSTGQHAVALEVVNKALAVAAQLQGQLAGDLVPLQVLRTHCLIALGQLADAHAQAVALYHAAHSARLGCATSTSGHHGRFKHEDQLHTSAIRVSEKAVEAVRDAWVRSGRALLQRDPGAELEAASKLTSGLLLQLKLQAHAPCVDNQQLCEELEEETARVLARLGKQLDMRALMKQEANERHA